MLAPVDLKEQPISVPKNQYSKPIDIITNIIKENKISENIDDVIWFLYNKIVMNF